MIKRESYQKRYEAGGLINPYAPYEKTEKYFKQKAEYFYGVYCANQASVFYGGANSLRTYKELRDHARGLQSTDKYRDILDPVSKKSKKRKWSISWAPVDFLSKFKQIIKDKMVSVRYIPHTVANDVMARTKKDKLASKMRLAVKPQGKEFLENIPYELSFQEKMKGLDNEDEVDFFINMGGIRLAVELAMKDGIDMTLQESEFDDSILPMLADDVIDLNACGVHVYLDRLQRKLIWEYVDPASVVIAASTLEDHRDADFAGFLKHRSIEYLRRQAGFDQETLEAIRKTYSGYNGSGFSQWSHNDDGRRENYATNRSYDQFGVQVLTIYWVDSQHYRHVVGTHKMGNTIYDPVNPDSELSGRDKKKGKDIEEVAVQCVYKCNWIVGTPYMYDFGVNDIVVREGKPGSKKALLPIIFWKGQDKSLIEKCIPFNDDIQLSTMKIRHLKNKIPPAPRMAIDKSKMTDSVRLGGRKYDWLELMEMYNATGVLMYETSGEYEIPAYDGQTSYGPPITFIPSGIAEDFSIFTQDILNSLEGIRGVTGVNPVVDGSNHNPDMLKAVMEGMMEATNSALRPDIAKIHRTFKRSAYLTMMLYRKALSTGEISYEDIPMTDEVRRVLKSGDDMVTYDWNLTVEEQTPQQRQRMMADLQKYSDFIPPETYFAIKNMIESGDIKKAELFLAKAVTEAKKEEYQRKLEISQAQAMAQGQAGQMVETAKQKTEQAKTQSKLMSIEAQAKADIAKMKEQAVIDERLERLKAELEEETRKEVVRENLKQTI